MKPVRITAAIALIIATFWLLGGPAGAVEETVGSCIVETIEEAGGPEAVEGTIEAGHADSPSTEAKESLETLEEDLERCLEAPSPIFPELNEIIWGGLAFFVLLAAMVRYGFPAVRGAMEGRTERIRSDLEAAEEARVEAERLKAQHEAELADSKAEAQKLYDEARQDASVLKAELQARAEADISEMRARAEADVASARQRALADLQGEVSEIVVGAAERVVQQNLDPATQQRLIDDYIANVGSH